MTELDRPDEPAPEADAALDPILAELDAAYHELPVEAIQEARRHRDAMAPRLIEVLRQASAAARSGKAPEGQAPFFALFLLAEFQAKEALPAILEAFSLPGELPFDLFGDAVTAVLARVLVALADDPIELFDRMIEDRGLNEFVRWEGAQAYQLLVRDGRLSRLEAVQRLQQHLRQATQRDDHTAAGLLVSELVCLAPAEAYEDIVEAYRRDVVDTFWIGLEDVEKGIAEGEAGFLQWQARCPPTGIGDTIAELENWACFSEQSPPSPPVARPPIPPAVSVQDPLPLPEPTTRRVGRNDPCPCGSGKKFKKCCGSRRG